MRREFTRSISAEKGACALSITGAPASAAHSSMDGSRGKLHAARTASSSSPMLSIGSAGSASRLSFSSALPVLACTLRAADSSRLPVVGSASSLRTSGSWHSSTSFT